MWSDKESQIDFLNFNETAQSIKDLITEKDLMPISVGVFGDWGAGKSTILELTDGLSHCKTALGLHPQLAHLRKNELVLFDKLVSQTRYIGEIGLDGSKGYKEYFSDQLAVFKHILSKCELFDDKILTIHSLNAVEQTIDCLKLFPKSGTPILHWFLATKKQVLEAAELGCYFSIGPAMLQSAREGR